MDRVDGLVAAATGGSARQLRHQCALARARVVARVLRDQEAGVPAVRAGRRRWCRQRRRARARLPRAQAHQRARRDGLGRHQHARSDRPQSAPVRGRGADGPEQRRGAGRTARVRHRAALAVVADASRYGALKERSRGQRHRGRGRRRGADRGGRAAGRLRDGRHHRRRRPADPTWRPCGRAAAWRSPTRNAWCWRARSSWRPCAEAGTELVPVDSEHSAAFQAIAGADPAAIERIVLTASGGPFRTWSLEELARATPAAGAAAIPTGRWAARSPSIRRR